MVYLVQNLYNYLAFIFQDMYIIYTELLPLHNYWLASKYHVEKKNNAIWHYLIIEIFGRKIMWAKITQNIKYKFQKHGKKNLKQCRNCNIVLKQESNRYWEARKIRRNEKICSEIVELSPFMLKNKNHVKIV